MTVHATFWCFGDHFKMVMQDYPVHKTHLKTIPWYKVSGWNCPQNLTFIP